MSIRGTLLALGIILVLLPLCALLAAWVWVLASQNPLQNPAATLLPWPVACTTRGCVTTASWLRQVETEQRFTAATGSNSPTAAQALTTIVRNHLAANAQLSSPVSIEDAARFREDILRISDEQEIKNTMNLSLVEYDRYVLLPILQQEALRQQWSVESKDELYTQLAAQRTVLILPFTLRWDTEKGEVVSR